MATLTAIQAASPLDASDDTRLLFTADTTETLSRALDNVDADLASMDTLSWQIEYRQSGRSDDTLSLGIRIVNGATILAAATSGGAFATVNSNVTNATDTTTGPTGFAYVNTTASRATWDGATVEIQQTYSQNMGKDGCRIEVDFVEFTGTYTAGASTTVNPAAVTVSASVPTPTISVTATTAPASTNVTATVPTADVAAAATVTPAAVSLPVTVPNPTAGVAVTVSPDPVNTTGTMPGPTVAAGGSASPAHVAAASTVPGPTVAGESVVGPSPVTVAATVPAPTVSVPTTVTPDPASLTVTMPAPTVVVEGSAAPSSVAATATVPTPDLIAEGVAVTPDPVNMNVTIPAAAPSGDQTISPALVAASVTVPGPATSVGGSASPDPANLTVTVPAPSVGQSGTAHPAVILVLVTVGGVTVTGIVVPITHRQVCRFYRNGTTLALVPLGRSQARGFRNLETVSDLFVLNSGEENDVMDAMTAVWAAHQGSDQATLTAAVNGRLQALGYRRVGGGALV